MAVKARASLLVPSRAGGLVMCERRRTCSEWSRGRDGPSSLCGIGQCVDGSVAFWVKSSVSLSFFVVGIGYNAVEGVAPSVRQEPAAVLVHNFIFVKVRCSDLSRVLLGHPRFHHRGSPLPADPVQGRCTRTRSPSCSSRRTAVFWSPLRTTCHGAPAPRPQPSLALAAGGR